MDSIHNLPAALKARNQWMPFILEPRPNSHKFDKKPARLLNGRYIPAAKTNTEFWSSYEEALQHVGQGKADGIGFCPNGTDIKIIDLDNCHSADGQLTPMAREIVDCVDGFVEISVSGTGLHIVTVNEELVGNSSGNFKDDSIGLEIMYDKSFVAMTGNVFEGRNAMPDSPTSIEAVKKHMGRSATRKDPAHGDAFANMDKRDRNLTLSDAEDILLHKIKPNPERQDWLSIGLALHFQFEGSPDALDLWDRYSQLDGAGNYKGFDDLAKAWAGFSIQHPNPISFASVYQKLKKPLSAEQILIDNPQIRLCTDKPKAVRYLLNGFIPEGVGVIAGNRGVGKTSIMMELVLIVSHLHPDKDHFLRVNGRRKVIYFTEDVEQLERTITGYRRFGGLTADENEINEWLIAINTCRYKENELQLLVKAYAEQNVQTYITPIGVEVKVPPLLVFDTASASFALEDETDNSGYSKMVSALKYGARTTGCPVVVVTHIAKSTRNQDVSDMTSRGASSLESDVQWAAAIAREMSLDYTVIKLNKTRVDPICDELNFYTKTHIETVTDEWGCDQTLIYRLGRIEKGSSFERIKQKAVSKAVDSENTKAKLRIDTCKNVLSILKNAKSGEFFNVEELRKRVGGGTDIAVDVIKRLQETGFITASMDLTETQRGACNNSKRKGIFLTGKDWSDSEHFGFKFTEDFDV